MLSDAISEHLFFKIFLGYTPSPPTFFASSASAIKCFSSERKYIDDPSHLVDDPNGSTLHDHLVFHIRSYI